MDKNEKLDIIKSSLNSLMDQENGILDVIRVFETCYGPNFDNDEKKQLRKYKKEHAAIKDERERLLDEMRKLNKK